MDHLNSDQLRTFLAIAETGSFTDGASRIFRSQSAASLQIRKLEDMLGQPVFHRHGRGVALTPAGERLLPVARDITQTLAATLRTLTSDDLQGTLRLGIPDDQSQHVLARIIAEFAQSHPRIELDVTCALSAGFPDALAAGELDIAVYEAEQPAADLQVLRTERTFWMMSRHQDVLANTPVPVALFDRECWWRDAALDALRRSKHPYRIVYTSQSVTGVAAAVEAGIAIGLLGETAQTPDMQILDTAHGFADMPASKLVLGLSPHAEGAAIAAMEAALEQAFA